MKNVIVGILTLIIFGLMGWTYSNGGAYNGGEHGKVIADLGNRTTAAVQDSEPQEKSDREKEDEALNALREKAGNINGFKVSDAYKSKCSSCHGVDGSGMQYGKKLMGPKLFGQSADAIYKKLDDFKSGRKENMVMKGLLLHMTKEDLRKFADEIGEFPARAKALK
ncbi:c-type cytochrome [Sulfurimonas paralvinellae]|uniref:C-type cytochrome n=1 Tax=Sulfurimonas paralvinellae TaxID=317658 RepID=A0A7M1BA49_9BACT|nr:c-type cytochrome [Sulfurimonas paralvinellae]QOP46525.1 c-type cytochrome [Sulfurimonas paralvinellae]